jgi:hypothetical protein
MGDVDDVHSCLQNGSYVDVVDASLVSSDSHQHLLRLAQIDVLTDGLAAETISHTVKLLTVRPIIMKQEYRSALIVAAVGGHALVVKLLLDAKANVDYADNVRNVLVDRVR